MAPPIEPTPNPTRPTRWMERGGIVLFLLTPSCLGGSSGEPVDAIIPRCLISRTAPPEVQAKYSGQYTTEWGMRASVDHECPHSEGTFEARVEFVVRDGDLPRRNCSALDPDWYTVVVELSSSDGSLHQTRTGLLSTHGTIDFDGNEAPRSIEVHPEERWVDIGLSTTTVAADKPLPPDIVSRPPWCPTGTLDGKLPDVIVETDFGEIELVHYTSYRANPGPSVRFGLSALTNRELGALALTREDRSDMSIVLRDVNDGESLVFDGYIDGSAPLADGTLDESSLHFWGEREVDGSFFVGLPDDITHHEHTVQLSVSFEAEGSAFVVRSVYLEFGSDETSAGLLRTMSDVP